MSRSAVMMWLLAVFHFDSRAAEPIQSIKVFTGQNVMLPCSCSEDTKKLVWQIGEKTVVNHCCDDHSYDTFYVNRTKVFLSSAKGNCSLLLLDVTLKDELTFTCHTFDGDIHLQNTQEVGLKVEQSESQTSPHNYMHNPENQTKDHTGFSVGVSLTVILVILSGLIVACFIKKHRLRRPRMMDTEEPQSTLPMVGLPTV